MTNDKPKRRRPAVRNPAWDPPEYKKARIAKRRERLAQIAKASGFESWSEVETAILNGRARIIKTTE